MGSFFEPFGDLVLALGNGSFYVYVGAPLPASELPGTTPTATGFPVSSPAPTPPPVEPPAGGISRQEAIRIVARYLHAPAKATPSGAEASFDGDYINAGGRWVWTIDFITSIGEGNNWADVDYFTGDIVVAGSGSY